MRSKTILVVVLLCIAFCPAMFGQQPTVTVSGSTDTEIRNALAVLSTLNPSSPTGKLVIPAGTYNISSTIQVPGTASPANLWIHCEPGAVLQVANTWTSLSPILQFQDLNTTIPLGSIRVDGCVFDMSTAAPPSQQNAVGIYVQVNSDGPGTSNPGNTGTIEIDHNEFRHSSLQGVLLQTNSTNLVSGPGQNTNQLLSGANVHDNICHDMYSAAVSGSSNPACFESKNTIGTSYRSNYMYNFPITSGSTPVFGILCNGDNGCSLKQNVCSYNTAGGASSAACYKGLFMTGYESDGNLFYGTGDCGSSICSFAEHCDTCFNSESHDNYFWNANTCIRMEVNQDDNIHDDRCYSPTEQGFIVSTREGQSGDTVNVHNLTSTAAMQCNTSLFPNCGALTNGTGVALSINSSFTHPLGTCLPNLWKQDSVLELTTSALVTGPLLYEDLGTGAGSAYTWITSPVIAVCIESDMPLSPQPLQWIFTDTCTPNCLTALASPHTVINFPGVIATSPLAVGGFIPAYGWSDSFAMNFASTRGVRAWGIRANPTSSGVPSGVHILLSVFVHDVPFMRHQIHNNHIVRSGGHGLYLQGALQNFSVDHNMITDPGFSPTIGTADAVRIDNSSTGLNTGLFPTQNGQINDNTFTNNGGSNTRRGIYYLNAGPTNATFITNVRNFHNFYQGAFNSTVTSFYPNTVTGSYYKVYGSATLAGGTVTVSFPAGGFTVTPYCVATPSTNGTGTAGILRVDTTTSSTSLTIKSTSASDNDTVNYECSIPCATPNAPSSVACTTGTGTQSTE